MVRTEEPDNSIQPGVAKLVAACLALSAFAIAVVAGIFAGNETLLVMTRALLAAAACYPAGFIAGIMFDCVIREQLAATAPASVEADVGNDSADVVERDTSSEKVVSTPPA